MLFEPAVMASLMSKDLNRKDVEGLVNSVDAGNVAMTLAILQPLKTITTILCSSSSPTISLILPFKNTILTVDADDCNFTKEGKEAIHKYMLPKYHEDKVKMVLLKATPLDPRFHSLPFVTEAERNQVFSELAVHAVHYTTTSLQVRTYNTVNTYKNL